MTYFLIALIVLLSFLFYIWYLKPRKQLARYAELFRQKGYKVIEKPCQPYSTPFYDELFQDSKKHEDPFYSHKYKYQGEDVILANMLTKPSIVVMNAEMLKEMMSPQKVMILPKENKIIEVFYSILRKGLVAIEGKKWKHRRKLISKVFNYDFITALVPEMIELADNIFDNFENKFKKDEEIKVDLFEMMVTFTSSVVVSGFVGIQAIKEKHKDRSIIDSLLKLVEMGTNTFNDPLLLIFGQKLLKRRWRQKDRQFLDLLHDVNSILKNFIDKQLENQTHQNKKEAGTNIIRLLLDERKKSQQSGQQSIQDDELIDQIKTFTVAGSDTSSNFLTGMLLYVFQKHAVLDRLVTEINSVIKTDKDITVQNFKKLEYLDCVINQTSRIFATVGGLFQRQLTEDTTLGGVPVKKDVLIDSLWVGIFYNPDTFQNPTEFIPERWQRQECKKNLSLISMLFSGGPRSCIGKQLALMEMKVMMIKFLKRYKSLVELGLKDGKRAYDFRFVYVVKDSKVILTRNQ